MRVLNRANFLAMPAGTIFCQGPRWAFGELEVKWESLETDFVAQAFNNVEASDPIEQVERLEHSLEAGASYPMEDAPGRDSLYDHDRMFLVFERDDLLKLRSVIDDAIEVAGDPGTS